MDFASILNGGFSALGDAGASLATNGLGNLGNLTAGLDFAVKNIPTTSFMDGISNVAENAADSTKNSGFFDTIKNWLGKDLGNGRTNLNNVIDLGTLGSQIWSGYNTQKMAEKNYELQKDAYDFNKYLSNEELKRRQNRENSLKQVWGS